MSLTQTSGDFRGTFKQGSAATIIFRLNEIDGSPLDPETIQYSIIEVSSGEEVVSHSTPEKVQTGIYVFDWNIPSTQNAGKYSVSWDYVVDDEAITWEQSIVVAAEATDSAYYSGRLLFMRQSLELMINAAQTVPVYRQFSRPSRDKKSYYFTKKNWNQARGTTVYLNKEIVQSGYVIDYAKGKVLFDNVLTDADTVQADYNFRWYTDEELDRFINNSTHVLNSFAPATYYTPVSMDDRHIATVLYGAAVDAIRSLMFSINWKEPEQFFGGPEAAGQKFGQLETLKKNYEDLWLKLLDQKKNFPYRGLTRMTVTPEYTLPGGRSRWFRYMFSGSAGAG